MLPIICLVFDYIYFWQHPSNQNLTRSSPSMIQLSFSRAANVTVGCQNVYGAISWNTNTTIPECTYVIGELLLLNLRVITKYKVFISEIGEATSSSERGLRGISLQLSQILQSVENHTFSDKHISDFFPQNVRCTA